MHIVNFFSPPLRPCRVSSKSRACACVWHFSRSFVDLDRTRQCNWRTFRPCVSLPISKMPLMQSTVAFCFATVVFTALYTPFDNKSHAYLLCLTYVICPRQVLYLSWWPLVRDSMFYLFSLVILILVLMDGIVTW